MSSPLLDITPDTRYQKYKSFPYENVNIPKHMLH